MMMMMMIPLNWRVNTVGAVATSPGEIASQRK